VGPPDVGVQGGPPLRGAKDTDDNVSHKVRFIFSASWGPGIHPTQRGFNEDPECKVQAAFIFFRH
jgi:hypothetical protein